MFLWPAIVGGMPELPNPALQCALWAIDDTWLEVQCCSGTTFLSLRLLARHHGADRRLGDAVARLIGTGRTASLSG
jgi:hypothetical protein